jgi:hypothetical protein
MDSSKRDALIKAAVTFISSVTAILLGIQIF